MKRIRNLTVTDDIPGPNPLDSRLVGVYCIYDGQPAVIYEERWFESERGGEPRSNVLVLHEWDGRIGQRGRISAISLENKVGEFIPIEPGTEASRQIAGHLLSHIALKLGFLTEKRLQGYSHSHPLIGVPCYFKEMLALPFGILKDTSCDDAESESYVPVESGSRIAFFAYEQDFFDKEKMNVTIRVDSADNTALMPIMSDTMHARHAFNTLLTALDERLDEQESPKPVEKVGQVATS